MSLLSLKRKRKNIDPAQIREQIEAKIAADNAKREANFQRMVDEALQKINRGRFRIDGKNIVVVVPIYENFYADTVKKWFYDRFNTTPYICRSIEYVDFLGGFMRRYELTLSLRDEEVLP